MSTPLTHHTTSKYNAYTDLASERLGGKVLYATDDFFAEKENLIKPGRGIFIPDKYTDRGKWMDGWESRRKRTPGHDWCVIELATTGRLFGFDIDTNHFLGNAPLQASVEAALLDQTPSEGEIIAEAIEWKEILPKSDLNPGSQNLFDCTDHKIYSHLRLHIYPDGGVARFRAYGEVYKDWKKTGQQEIDLAAAIHGAQALACNDMFFSAMQNLLLPGRGINMGDGWETKRNRTPNNRDWVIIRLATKGKIERIVVDTCHFKGNYPDSCSVQACVCDDDNRLLNDQVEWFTLLEKQKLSADCEHIFATEIQSHTAATHVRLNIFPDGGVSRLRLFGKQLGS